MKYKLSDFIVKNRKPVFVTMAILTLICTLLMLKVPINTDMSKYLPDDSSMKIGSDLMAEEFPDTTIPKTIRVMFTGIEQEETADIVERLAALDYVDEVAYEADSADYNIGEHKLFILSTSFDYNSKEEKAIQQAVAAEFQDYSIEIKNDNTNSDTAILTLPIIAGALSLLLFILFFMSYSWVEPILFLITIAFAVAINMGTNIFLGSISNVTFAIAAILQLVLSMDYSIILMNRYRQELPEHASREEAMKSAVVNAFSSITSSSMTTFIGLLMLVFMSFKIGFDLGLVLAKGVALSLFCVLTVLPGLILTFHDAIMRTEKMALHIPMGAMAKFSSKFKHIMAVLFIFIFIGSYFGQNIATVSYSLDRKDPIAEIFPTNNPIVMLYHNEDEAEAAKLVAQLENKTQIDEVVGYATTLGKAYQQDELSDFLADMDTEMVLEDDLLNLLYYDYHTADSDIPNLTMSQFLTFLSEEVAHNDLFSEQLDADFLDYIDEIQRFTNADKLSRPLSIGELAEFLDLTKDDVEQLLILYYSEHGGVELGEMTLSQFSTFLNDDVLTDETYSSLLDKEMTKQLTALQTFTDKEAVTAPLPAAEMAALLGMEIEQVEQIYQFYQMAQMGTAVPPSNDAAAMPNVDPSMLQNIDPSMLQNIDPSMLQNLTPEQLAMLGAMQSAPPAAVPTPEAKPAEPILLSVQEMISFLLESEQVKTMLDAATLTDLEQAQTIINSSLADTSYTAQDMANFMAQSEKDMEQLYLLRQSNLGNTADWQLSVQNFVDFLLADVLTNVDYADQFDADQTEDLQTAKKIIDAVVSQKYYPAAEMTSFLQSLNTEDASSLNENSLSLLYLYRASLTQSNPEWTITLEALVDYLTNDLLNNPKYQDVLDDEMRTDILTMNEEFQTERKKLSGENYTLLMLDTSLPQEGAETNNFIADLFTYTTDNFEHKAYLIGSSVMNYEMENSFDQELLTITLLTAISIFLVVAVTFRSLAIPSILVLIVQCGVFVTVTVSGLLGYSIYYLALLIVQCILMGATIDYGILYTSYYQEFRRKGSNILESLATAYQGSIHTIMTSGSIIIVVTGVLGFFSPEPIIGQICKVISLGTLSAVILILFVLPSLLATFDKFVVKNK